VARAQMAAEGTAAVTLRAIAREMGMTAPALYRYFGSRDELVAALVVDAYDSLADAMEGAVGAVAPDRHADRIRAAFGAFRRWALEHPVKVRVPPALEHQLDGVRQLPELPTPVLAFGLGAWARLHGLVALEVFGHLRPAIGDSAALFEQELEAILRQSGLDA
jgi:AcrR family transcriptional regulator